MQHDVDYTTHEGMEVTGWPVVTISRGRRLRHSEGLTANMPRVDLVVPGAGIVGVSTALQLVKRGLSVVLLDRLSPGEGMSYGNPGVLGGAGGDCLPEYTVHFSTWGVDE